MKWLRRQWYRVQLARELLDQYEREEASRIPLPEALRLLHEYHERAVANGARGHERWNAAIAKRLEQYLRA